MKYSVLIKLSNRKMSLDFTCEFNQWLTFRFFNRIHFVRRYFGRNRIFQFQLSLRSIDFLSHFRFLIYGFFFYDPILNGFCNEFQIIPKKRKQKANDNWVTIKVNNTYDANCTNKRCKNALTLNCPYTKCNRFSYILDVIHTKLSNTISSLHMKNAQLHPQLKTRTFKSEMFLTQSRIQKFNTKSWWQFKKHSQHCKLESNMVQFLFRTFL